VTKIVRFDWFCFLLASSVIFIVSHSYCACETCMDLHQIFAQVSDASFSCVSPLHVR